nr:uncharacterized protein LOC104120051 [Nicotiana tomentosiformis]XP_009630028.1 uncharacterized protein LOC104120051 [Nicotiana tomentosiformis]
MGFQSCSVLSNQEFYQFLDYVGTRKQSFSKTIFEECECINRSGGVGSNSTISQLINAQNSVTEQIRKLKARNAILEGQFSQTQETAGSSNAQNTEVACLTKKNAALRRQVEDLKERLLTEQGSANARMNNLLRTFVSSSASRALPSGAP